MNISAIDHSRIYDLKPKTDKIGVMVAQKSLEAAKQNQENVGTGRTGSVSSFSHPFLGHNIDIYV